MTTQLNDDLYRLIQNGSIIKDALANAQGFLNEKKMGNALTSLGNAIDFSHAVQAILNKYEGFLESIDQKFGTDFKQACNSAKKLITEIVADIKNTCINISTGKTDIAQSIMKSPIRNQATLENELGKIRSLPHIIDFSKLSHHEWKEIGIPGVHFKSRIFLSYPFRDKDPTKDENQKFIDYLMIPLLNLFNIESVTARTHLQSQEQIEENTIALVADCDGIIGFFTTGDSIENVEHELANNPNVVAICREEGANPPSMRRSRLQLDFRRNEPSQLLLGIAKALKDKEMFRLYV